MEEPGGVVNGENMDLAMNEPIDDSVGALDHLPDRWIIGFRDNTSGLREGRQSLDCCNQLLPDKFSVVRRVLGNELPDGLNIFYSPTSPDQWSHVRS
jgi:hypothetical protein